jgi:uncharacterized protein (TIGR03083 family)
MVARFRKKCNRWLRILTVRNVRGVKITPRYDTDPIISLDGPPSAIVAPFLRQRRRFAQALSSLSPEHWSAASRCVGWRVQDVVAHLTTTDRFWSFAIAAGLAGTPTRVLADFDPKATPAALVDAVRDAPSATALTQYLEATSALCALVESFDDGAWGAVAESPPGHVTISALLHHALWDSWVHERDVLLPLGIAPDEEPDEVIACLRYAAGLSPAFAMQTAGDRRGALALVVDHPDARILVTVDAAVHISDAAAPPDALVVTGDAVELLEALSVRAPWPYPFGADDAWLVAALGAVFESTPAG